VCNFISHWLSSDRSERGQNGTAFDLGVKRIYWRKTRLTL